MALVVHSMPPLLLIHSPTCSCCAPCPRFAGVRACLTWTVLLHPCTPAPSAVQTCQRPLPAEDGILPTQLFTHREDVDTINLKQLRALPSEARKFVAQDVGSGDVLAAACPARRSLDLKVGGLKGA